MREVYYDDEFDFDKKYYWGNYVGSINKGIMDLNLQFTKNELESYFYPFAKRTITQKTERLEIVVIPYF